MLARRSAPRWAAPSSPSARGTVLASALATIALGLLTVAVLASAWKERPLSPHSPVTGSLQLSFMLPG